MLPGIPGVAPRSGSSHFQTTCNTGYRFIHRKWNSHRHVQPGEGVQEHALLLLAHLARLHGGAEGDVDHALWVRVQEVLEVLRQRLGAPDVDCETGKRIVTWAGRQ